MSAQARMPVSGRSGHASAILDGLGNHGIIATESDRVNFGVRRGGGAEGVQTARRDGTIDLLTKVTIIVMIGSVVSIRGFFAPAALGVT